MRFHFSFFIVFLLAVTTTSCLSSDYSESEVLEDMSLSQFKDVDYKELQQTINSRSGIKTGMDALRLYYPNNQDANSSTRFTFKTFDNNFGNNYLLFKQEDLNDDSLSAIAIFMEYETSLTGKIQVLDLKESYQCQQGRGHQEWSGELCQ